MYCICSVVKPDITSVLGHSTFLYMAYLYDGTIYSVCHPLKVPDRTELKQVDSHLIDKMDLISCSQNQVEGFANSNRKYQNIQKRFILHLVQFSMLIIIII